MKVYDAIGRQDSPCSSTTSKGVSDMVYIHLLLLRCVVNCIILHFGMLNDIFQSLAHLVRYLGPLVIADGRLVF